MLWIVTADTNTCRIYSLDKKHTMLSLIKEINHPELKLKTSETFTTDKPGHYQASDSARGTYSPHMDPKEVAIDDFARDIDHALDKGRNDHAYEKLVLIAAPRMHGLLNQHLNKNVANLVMKNIEKDVQHLNHQELLEFIKKHTQYSNE